MKRQNAGSIKIQVPESNLHLPQDIIEEILSRLPVKALLKFRCVSKSWRSLIGSKRFIKTHLQKSTKSASLSRHRIIVNPEHHRVLMLLSWRSVLRNPFRFDDIINVETEVNLVGCCNGLVCILQDTGRFVLWNPSTRIAKNLPDAGNTGVGKNLVGEDFTKYGFGYDELSDDFKVFVVITLSCSRYLYRVITRVYSLKTNSWKTLTDELDSGIHCEGAGIFASGNLHWVMNNREIVSFVLKSEVDGMVEQPSYPKGDIFPNLGVIEGCLSVLCVRVPDSDSDSDSDNEYGDSYLDVWVMKEYGVQESWVKVATLPNFRHNLDSEELVTFSRGPNGEILVIHSSTFVIYYPEDNGVRRRPRIKNNDSLMEAYFYFESLVSVASDAEPVV